MEATARPLEGDRARLPEGVRRLPPSVLEALLARGPATASFVEVDAERVFSRGQLLVRLTSRDGAQLERALDRGAAELTAVARAF